MSYESFQNPRVTTPDVDQGTSAAYEDAYQRANYRATYGGDVEGNFRAGEPQQQTQAGGQWRATYGSDVQSNFRPGTPSESTGRYRATYGSDVANNFRPGVQSDSNGTYRATYGSDVANNFRPGVQSESAEPYRATYGSDVENNFRAGQQSQYEGTSDPYRATYGSDVGQTYVVGGDNTTGQQWRPDYGSDVGQTYIPGQTYEPGQSQYEGQSQQWQDPDGGNVWQSFRPQTPGYVATNDSYSGSQYESADQYRELDNNIWQLDAPFARAAQAQYDQYLRSRSQVTDNRQTYGIDPNGRQMSYLDNGDYGREQYGRSHFIDPRQEYLQQMMVTRISSMIQNHGGTINLYYNGNLQNSWQGNSRPRTRA